MDFRNLFFVFFLKSRRTRRNKNLTHFVQLKISYGQASKDSVGAHTFHGNTRLTTRPCFLYLISILSKTLVNIEFCLSFYSNVFKRTEHTSKVFEKILARDTFLNSLSSILF